MSSNRPAGDGAPNLNGPGGGSHGAAGGACYHPRSPMSLPARSPMRTTAAFRRRRRSGARVRAAAPPPCPGARDRA